MGFLESFGKKKEDKIEREEENKRERNWRATFTEFFLLLLLLNCLGVGAREPIFLCFLVTLYFVLWQTWQYIKNFNFFFITLK